MGLFSFLKKKRKTEEPSVRQAGLRRREVTDPEVRKNFYAECSDFIDEAILQTEQAKNEYGLVTSYLSDVEKVEGLRGESRTLVTDAANRLVKLEEEKKKIGRQEPKISDAQKRFLAMHEDEIPEKIQWLFEEEKRQHEIEGKLHYLEGEKAVYATEHEDCVSKDVFLKRLVLIVSCCVIAIIGVLLWLGETTGKNLRVSVLLTAIVGIAVAMYAVIEKKNTLYKLQVANIKKNKVIAVENKIKLKYVNCTWAVDYAYEKYHVTGSLQLKNMWNEYMRIKAEEARFRKNEQEAEVYRNTITRELKRAGVKDPGIWVLQPQALLDDREMVEVRHGLNVRRQKLREHIDYNAKQKDENEKAILRFIAEYPEYIEETRPLLTKYRLLQRNENREV